jgi:hypothetical protein
MPHCDGCGEAHARERARRRRCGARAVRQTALQMCPHNCFLFGTATHRRRAATGAEARAPHVTGWQKARMADGARRECAARAGRLPEHCLAESNQRRLRFSALARPSWPCDALAGASGVLLGAGRGLAGAGIGAGLLRRQDSCAGNAPVWHATPPRVQAGGSSETR